MHYIVYNIRIIKLEIDDSKFKWKKARDKWEIFRYLGKKYVPGEEKSRIHPDIFIEIAPFR